MCKRGGSNVVVAFDGRLDGLGMPSASRRRLASGATLEGGVTADDLVILRDARAVGRSPPGIASSRASTWRGGRRENSRGTRWTWARRRGAFGATAPVPRRQAGGEIRRAVPPSWPGRWRDSASCAASWRRARCPPAALIVRASPSPIHTRSGRISSSDESKAQVIRRLGAVLARLCVPERTFDLVVVPDTARPRSKTRSAS